MMIQLDLTNTKTYTFTMTQMKVKLLGSNAFYSPPYGGNSDPEAENLRGGRTLMTDRTNSSDRRRKPSKRPCDPNS